MYKLEKSKGGKLKLFILAEAEGENGEKVMVRRLLKEQKVKAFIKGIEDERKMYEEDIKTAEDGMSQLDEIKMLIDNLNADSKAE